MPRKNSSSRKKDKRNKDEIIDLPKILGIESYGDEK